MCGGTGGGRSRGGLGGLITHEELYVAQVEGGGERGDIAIAVFPGSKDKEESDPARSTIAWSRG